MSVRSQVALVYLGRGYDRLPCKIAHTNHHLLCQEDLLRRDLHAKVPTSNLEPSGKTNSKYDTPHLNNEGTHHDPISGLEDFREVVQTFLILNLHKPGWS